MNELVSIIMPSYNTAKYIKESIESVISQTYVDWELIIVDDCSTDGTDEIVNEIDDDRIVFLKNKQNLGAALCRNKALQIAKGKYIAFLDSDDLWKPDKLERIICFMRENNYSLVYHEYEKINEESKKLKIYVSGPKTITKRTIYHYDYVGFLTLVYDSDVHGLIQIADIKKNNDYAILLKLCKKDSCHLLKENLAFYRIRKNSISHDSLIKKIKSHYYLYRLCDNKNFLSSLYFSMLNMFFGVIKKMVYEKKY